MPSPFRPVPAPPPSQIALEPVYNALNSMALLHAVERLPGCGRWVLETARALQPEQIQANRIIFEEFGAALLIGGSWPDVPAYLDALATQHPGALRDRVLAQRGPAETPSSEAAALLADPFQMHDLIVAHLRDLWKAHLAAEWMQVQRSLQEQVNQLRHSLPGSGLSPAAIAQNLHTFIAVAAGPAPGAQAIVFVPSAHNGRYITQLQVDATLYLFFDAALHDQVLLRDTPVKQVELIGRLSALTESARLRVLALLAQHGELALQDLMAQLGTSQPNVSRYLKALGSYVQERRGKDGRKRYRLVPTQLDVTFQALKQAVLAPPAPTTSQSEDDMQIQGLARYLDGQGGVLFWPAQAEDRAAVLGYLAGRFAEGQLYSEKEVNAVLAQLVAPHVRDHVTVRRDLIDQRLLQRSDDGARYWRGSENPGQPPRVLSDEEAYRRYWGADLPDSND
jgi:DNA-binding transcriptional ArsR family regulator